MVEPGEKLLGGEAPHCVAVLVDHRDSGLEGGRGREVAEPNVPNILAAQCLQRGDQRDGAARVRREHCARRAGCVEHAPERCGHRRCVEVTDVHQVIALGQSSLVQRQLAALQPQQHRHRVVAHECNAAVPVRDQVPGCFTAAADVVLYNRVRAQPAGFSVGKHERCALLPRPQVRHVPADRADDHSRHLALQHRLDGPLFVRRLPADAGHDDGDATAARLVLDGANDACEERVGHAGHRHTDSGVATRPEGNREHVGHVLQIDDRSLDPFADVRGHVAVVVDHARDGLGAHPRPVGNVAHGRHRASFRGRSAVSMSPMSDRMGGFSDTGDIAVNVAYCPAQASDPGNTNAVR
jgi:hypothetical protein